MRKKAAALRVVDRVEEVGALCRLEQVTGDAATARDLADQAFLHSNGSMT
jgi:hypothetical protein